MFAKVDRGNKTSIISQQPFDDDNNWYEIPEELLEVGYPFYVLENSVLRAPTPEEKDQDLYELNTPMVKSDLSRNIELFLNQTDWLVTRHRDQVDAGSTTSLTTTEFQDLVNYRGYLRSLHNSDIDYRTYSLQEYTLNDRYNCEAYQFMIEMFDCYRFQHTL